MKKDKKPYEGLTGFYHASTLDRYDDLTKNLLAYVTRVNKQLKKDGFEHSFNIILERAP